MLLKILSTAEICRQYLTTYNLGVPPNPEVGKNLFIAPFDLFHGTNVAFDLGVTSRDLSMTLTVFLKKMA